jgi:hypothetical protein
LVRLPNCGGRRSPATRSPSRATPQARSTIPKNGVHLDIGTVVGDTYLACAVIGSAGALANLLATSGADGVPAVGGDHDICLRQRQSTTIRLPGYAGGATNTAAVESFVAANNPTGGPSVTASVSSHPAAATPEPGQFAPRTPGRSNTAGSAAATCREQRA